ncbi:Type II restriction enzyme EcoRV [Bordetella sputigena]|uniref:type II restriction endonuclease n=1 Tax=Bordetella sputigena TaxID=1416810 RepID=UPI0039F020D9
MSDFKAVFERKLLSTVQRYAISGVVSQDGVVYPLGSDTKVLSTIFELYTRPLMIETAAELGLDLVEPSVQNHYPDFTLCAGAACRRKIAVDVKTTYINHPGQSFNFTLGGYTSFIRPGNERKNIVFPFSDYVEHWVVGYVYERVAEKKAAQHAYYTLDQLPDIPLPYRNVRVFVQEKWRIASYRAGSGNTTNIGSITGRIEDFRNGNGPFRSEQEFLDYWRNYGRKAADRERFKDIETYRRWRGVEAI